MFIGGILVITKDYGVRATTIEGQNALLHRCALRKFRVTYRQITRDQITSDGRSKRAWSNCVLCLPFILSGSPNEFWRHTCDACVTTRRLGLRAGSSCRPKGALEWSYYGIRIRQSFVTNLLYHNVWTGYCNALNAKTSDLYSLSDLFLFRNTVNRTRPKSSNTAALIGSLT